MLHIRSNRSEYAVYILSAHNLNIELLWDCCWWCLHFWAEWRYAVCVRVCVCSCAYGLKTIWKASINCKKKTRSSCVLCKWPESKNQNYNVMAKARKICIWNALQATFRILAFRLSVKKSELEARCKRQFNWFYSLDIQKNVQKISFDCCESTHLQYWIDVLELVVRAHAFRCMTHETSLISDNTMCSDIYRCGLSSDVCCSYRALRQPMFR